MTKTDPDPRGVTAHSPLRIQVLHVPDCPLVGEVRARLRDCLGKARIAVEVEDREGAYPSPTLLIDGLDVATGGPAASGTCCRLDLPTSDQILTALERRS
jgi:hypothetical protein